MTNTPTNRYESGDPTDEQHTTGTPESDGTGGEDLSMSAVVDALTADFYDGDDAQGEEKTQADGADEPTGGKKGGLSFEESIQLLSDLAMLQEELSEAEKQTHLARKHVEIVKDQLAKVNAEKSTWSEQLARQRGEFENYRKRVEREKQELRVQLGVDIVGKVLEVLDNLERAISSERNDSVSLEAFLEGVELIHKQLYDTLASFGLTPIAAAVGEPFDPAIHEAVVTEETTDLTPNTILRELKRGYFLGDRLLRPAMVVVAVRS